jgi:hypothetical protein
LSIQENNLLSLEGEDKGEGEGSFFSPPHPIPLPNGEREPKGRYLFPCKAPGILSYFRKTVSSFEFCVLRIYVLSGPTPDITIKERLCSRKSWG